MHLALGSQRLDLTDGAAVVGTVDARDRSDVVASAHVLADAGALALWLPELGDRSAAIEAVSAVREQTGRPVIAPAADPTAAVELATAGVVAVGARATDRATIDAVAGSGLTLVVRAEPSAPDPVASMHRAATQAGEAGLDPSRIVLELTADRTGLAHLGHLDPTVGLPGVVVDGRGPGAWALVTLAIGAGAHVVRTTDVHSVRRVAAVAARLVAARPTEGAGVTSA